MKRTQTNNSTEGNETEVVEIQLRTADGTLIPQVDKVIILGLIIEAKDNNGETVRKFEGTVSQIIQLIKRITNKHNGIREKYTSLVQAFVLSKIVYVVPYTSDGMLLKRRN